MRQFVEARSQRIQITGSGPFLFWPPLCRLSSTCAAGRPFSAFPVHRTWVCLRTPRSFRSPLAYNLHIHRSVSSSCNWKFRKKINLMVEFEYVMNNLQWRPIQMRIFHSNESFLLASYLPPKKRGNRERIGAK